MNVTEPLGLLHNGHPAYSRNKEAKAAKGLLLLLLLLLLGTCFRTDCVCNLRTID